MPKGYVMYVKSEYFYSNSAYCIIMFTSIFTLHILEMESQTENPNTICPLLGLGICIYFLTKRKNYEQRDNANARFL